MTPPAPTPNPDPESPLSTGASGGLRRERRALAWGVGISIAVHLVLVALYPAIMDRIDPGPAMVELPDRDRPEPSMEVVLLLETDPPEEAEPEEEDAPTPELPPDPEPAEEPLADPEAEPTPAPAEDAFPELELTPEEVGEEEEELRRHIAERLQPQTPDPRLWAFGDAEYMDLSDEERAQLMIYGMMQDWNDSVAVAAALSDRATDWTYTDDDGRRWGLSPGRIHLGDFSVPLPFTFDTPPGIRDRVNRDRWIADDIARGAASQAIRHTWAERAREIRRRMDEERERERSGGGG